MLRSIVSSIEFEKFRRNWSENEQLSVSLLWSLDGSRAILTMKFASDSPQFSYVELTLLRTI
ncbi:hypothetical protein [Leptospira noguchii]|uniref:hypothetical protein n=1 Tax=Leptospira noguchii TaxID=28182 RepID=UPI0012FB3944|nr:hypothetical protein [Leptospira noguchii]UOG32325.1 hypothetical protein MAL06_13465 [Leptospira noguchii]